MSLGNVGNTIHSSTELVCIVHRTKLILWSDAQPGVLLLVQILHDPLRQRFGRGGVLSRIQFTVNNDPGLENAFCTLEFSSELLDLVL